MIMILPLPASSSTFEVSPGRCYCFLFSLHSKQRLQKQVLISKNIGEEAAEVITPKGCDFNHQSNGFHFFQKASIKHDFLTQEHNSALSNCIVNYKTLFLPPLKQRLSLYFIFQKASVHRCLKIDPSQQLIKLFQLLKNKGKRLSPQGSQKFGPYYLLSNQSDTPPKLPPT